MCRNQVGGDMAAAALLYRVKYYFDTENVKKKLSRFEKDWIAMSRSAWASEAGLSEAQMKNRALPIIRKCQFISIRQMRLNPKGPKLLWINLDLVYLYEGTQPDEVFQNQLNAPKKPAVPKKPPVKICPDDDVPF